MLIDRTQLKEVTGVDFYDGSILHSRFAYKFLRKEVKATGDLIAFVAPMQVTAHLVDLEDALNADYIYSENAINFLLELPQVDLYGAVCYQRLFNTFLGSALAGLLDVEIGVDGDDIMVNTPEGFKKASVSIAHKVSGACLIHTGINIMAGPQAPSFAYSTLMSEELAKTFMLQAENKFYTETQDIFVATTKVIA